MSEAACCSLAAGSMPEVGQHCEALTALKLGGQQTLPSLEKDGNDRTGLEPGEVRCSCTACCRHHTCPGHACTQPHAHGLPLPQGRAEKRARRLDLSSHLWAYCLGQQECPLSMGGLMVGPSRS